MTEHEDFIRDAYDRFVLDAGEDGIKTGEAAAHVAGLLAQAIRDGHVTISEAEYAQKVTKQIITGIRTARRAGLVETALWVQSMLAGETILGSDDPVLKMAYPGSADSIDKSLVYWTEDDWNTATMTRYRKAAEATAAAVAFDNVASAIVTMLKGRSTGDALGLS